MGEPALWGNPLGETAPNAGYSQGYCGGNRPQRGIRKGCRWLLSRLLWGNPPPTRVIVGEPAPNAGYSQGYRKGCRWLLSRL